MPAYDSKEYYIGLWEDQESSILGALSPDDGPKNITHFEALGQPTHHYTKKYVADEFWANSNAAEASKIEIRNNFNHLPVSWKNLPNVFFFGDNGRGLGSMKSEEDHTKIIRRFTGFGFQKEAEHKDDLGKYGKGGHANSKEIASVQIIISKHSRDLEDSCCNIFLHTLVGVPQTFWVQAFETRQGKIKISGSNAKEFHKWVETWTPIRSGDWRPLLSALFDETDNDHHRKTGLVYLNFGLKTKVSKDDIQERAAELYYRPPKYANGEPVTDFQVTFNDEQVPIVYMQDKYTTLREYPTFNAVYTNGYYPINKGDTTCPQKAQSVPTPICIEGVPLECSFSVVLNKEPGFNPTKNTPLNVPILFVCGNNAIRMNMKKLHSWWNGKKRYEILKHLMCPVTHEKSKVWAHLHGKCGARNERFWKACAIGYDVTLVIHIPPFLLEFTKKKFVSSYRKFISHLMLACLQKSMPFLNEYSMTCPDDIAFKYIWRYGSNHTNQITANMQQTMFEHNQQPASVPWMNRDMYMVEGTKILPKLSPTVQLQIPDILPEIVEQPPDQMSDQMSDQTSESDEQRDSDEQPSEPVVRAISRKRTRPLSSVSPALVPAIEKKRKKRKEPKEKRKNFGNTTWKYQYDSQKGLCANPKCRISLQLMLADIDHIDGNRHNNSEDNCHLLCVNCHRIKSRQETQDAAKMTAFRYENMEQNPGWTSSHMVTLESLYNAKPELSPEEMEYKKKMVLKWSRELYGTL